MYLQKERRRQHGLKLNNRRERKEGRKEREQGKEATEFTKDGRTDGRKERKGQEGRDEQG
jgi:hypothetical protein